MTLQAKVKITSNAQIYTRDQILSKEGIYAPVRDYDSVRIVTAGAFDYSSLLVYVPTGSAKVFTNSSGPLDAFVEVTDEIINVTFSKKPNSPTTFGLPFNRKEVLARSGIYCLKDSTSSHRIVTFSYPWLGTFVINIEAGTISSLAKSNQNPNRDGYREILDELINIKFTKK